MSRKTPPLTWHHNGLRYFAIGDASAQDLDTLSELIKAAG